MITKTTAAAATTMTTLNMRTLRTMADAGGGFDTADSLRAGTSPGTLTLDQLASRASRHYISDMIFQGLLYSLNAIMIVAI